MDVNISSQQQTLVLVFGFFTYYLLLRYLKSQKHTCYMLYNKLLITQIATCMKEYREYKNIQEYMKVSWLVVVTVD